MKDDLASAGCWANQVRPSAATGVRSGWRHVEVFLPHLYNFGVEFNTCNGERAVYIGVECTDSAGGEANQQEAIMEGWVRPAGGERGGLRRK